MRGEGAEGGCKTNIHNNEGRQDKRRRREENKRKRREGSKNVETHTNSSPLLATDEVEIREAAKLSRVIQRMEVQFLQTTQHNTN